MKLLDHLKRVQVRLQSRTVVMGAVAAGLLTGACGSDSSDGGIGDGDGDPFGDIRYTQQWFEEQTIADRSDLPLPGAQEWLDAGRILSQLSSYDPGSMARCEADEDADYNLVVDELGGVLWGYGVARIQDYEKPLFLSGYRFIGGDGDSVDVAADGGAVEIAEADIVGVGETSALFISQQHGLLMIDLNGGEVAFQCAAKLPGKVDQFYLHNERLVVMTQAREGGVSHLLHFDVSDNQISFVESVNLGVSKVLDSRRFNDRLVMYTDLTLEGDNPPPMQYEYDYYDPSLAVQAHRVLRVFNWGETLEEELTETAIDESPTETYLTSAEIDENTPIGSSVSQTTRYGQSMWASDRYFVITEEVTDITIASWEMRSYSVCVESHTVTTPYTSCSTEYETRPNPNYVPPDNTGGDRSCTGQTLSDCIRKVSQESSETISVPVGRTCVEAERSHWICDRSETRMHSYPTYNRDTNTRLYVYEYTEDGFIRFADEVGEIDDAGLVDNSLDATVDVLPMTDELSQLTVPGYVQALRFQNGYLYVISEGVLQTYALAENSLLRTSTLSVVGGSIQSTRFTQDKLYLSDSRWGGGGDQSVLRVIDLSNPAFPAQSSTDRVLPGGHSVITPTTSGIMTVGYVNRFEGEAVNLLKVGLFEDPSAVELSYLFLGTDLQQPRFKDVEAMYFDSANERLFLPYSGRETDLGWTFLHRVGVSHLAGGEVVTEGAVDLPQEPERVRPRPGTEQVLTFASSSVSVLTQGASEWEASSVFEYYTPTGVYRYSEDDDYVEVSNLGNRCRLQFTHVDEINNRVEEKMSESFVCPNGHARGFGMHLLFNDVIAVSFDGDGNWELVDEAEAADMWERSNNRIRCLFSDEIVQGSILIDAFDPPDIAALFCQTYEDYLESEQEANGY